MGLFPQLISRLKPSVNDIWVTAATEQNYPLISNYQVWPETKLIDVDLEKELIKTDAYPNIIKLTPGLEKELRYEAAGEINPRIVEDLLLNGVLVQV